MGSSIWRSGSIRRVRAGRRATDAADSERPSRSSLDPTRAHLAGLLAGRREEHDGRGAEGDDPDAEEHVRHDEPIARPRDVVQIAGARRGATIFEVVLVALTGEAEIG